MELLPTAGLEDQLGQANVTGVTFLVAFPMASPCWNLGFQGFLRGVQVGIWSRSVCEQGMPAPEKLVKTMEMDLRVKMWEAGLAD